MILPQMVLAAWWNPFSWGVWNIFSASKNHETSIKQTTNQISQPTQTKPQLAQQPIKDKTDKTIPSASKNSPVKSSVQSSDNNLAQIPIQPKQLPVIDVYCSASLNPNSPAFLTDFGSGASHITFKASLKNITNTENMHYSWSGGCSGGDSLECTTTTRNAAVSSTTLTVVSSDGGKGSATCLPTALDISCDSSPTLINPNQSVNFTVSAKGEDINSMLFHWYNACDSQPSVNTCTKIAGSAGSVYNNALVVAKDGNQIGIANCSGIICLPDNLNNGEWSMTRKIGEKCEFINCSKNSDCGINTANIIYKCRGHKTVKGDDTFCVEIIQ